MKSFGFSDKYIYVNVFYSFQKVCYTLFYTKQLEEILHEQEKIKVREPEKGKDREKAEEKATHHTEHLDEFLEKPSKGQIKELKQDYPEEKLQHKHHEEMKQVRESDLNVFSVKSADFTF